MKILILQSHAMNGFNIEAREFLASKQLAKLGNSVSVHTMSMAVEADSILEDRDGVKCYFHKVDNPAADSANRISQHLVSAVVNECPEAIFFKGLGYDIVQIVLNNIHSNCKKIIILGGKSVHSTLIYFDSILYEYDGQVDDIRNAVPQKNFQFVWLPKFLDWRVISSCRNFEKKYDICCVGAMIQRKNQSALYGLFGKSSIAFVGSGQMLDQHVSFARNHQDVHFFGQLTKKDVYKVISQSRIMVHPSLFEGMPRVSAESMACGTPFVGLKSTLEKVFKTKDFVKLYDQNSLVDSVLKLLDNQEELDRLSEESFAYTKDNFSHDAIYNAFVSVLNF